MNLFDQTVIVVELKLPDGELLRREWKVDTPGKPVMQDPPEWMENRRRLWPVPQDPITFKADVTAGFEDAAREWLAQW